MMPTRRSGRRGVRELRYIGDRKVARRERPDPVPERLYLDRELPVSVHGPVSP